MVEKKVTISSEVCKGCGLCVHVCPKKVMALDKSRINSKGYNPANVTDNENCISCGMCGIICPDSAIKVEK